VIGTDAFITPNVRSNESEDHIMRYQKFTAARSHLKPLAALLLATTVGGCIGYADYPSRDYGYSHHSNYYTGYPRTYGNSDNYRPYYSPDYSRYNSPYETRGGGGN
jgi:hypothetical protein